MKYTVMLTKKMTCHIRIISDSQIPQKKFYKTPQLLTLFKRCTYFSEPTRVRRISVLVKVLISIQTLGGGGEAVLVKKQC